MPPSPCRDQFTYSCGRCSPVWRVSRRAMTCPSRPHSAYLAIPKKPHPFYEPARQVGLTYMYMVVT